MIFFKLFKRPTITLSATSRLYGWTTTSGREAPSTACAALQSSIEGGALGVRDRVARMVRASQVLKTALIVILIISMLVGWGSNLYFMVLRPMVTWEADWTQHMEFGVFLGGSLVAIISAVVLYYSAKWAGEHLCPIKLQFSPTDS